LNGAISAPSGQATIQWKLYSGPAGVAIDNPSQPATTVNLSAPGTYTFLLSADDGVHAVAYDAVVVRVTGRDALANISTRTQVGAGNNVAIGGFIILGNAAKQMVLRGLGPSLATAGVQGALNDSVLELYDSGVNLLQSNDDWEQTQAQEIRDAQLAPPHQFESAILRILAPGAYTVVLRGKGSPTGVGLVEMYDLQTSAASKLGNISTRGLVGAGENVLIGGTIVTGPDPARVVFRAIGPSLANAGIQNPLGNPQLDLFDANGSKIATNDNWKTSQQSALIATGLSPSVDLESAIIADLSPGSYTAIVSGVNGATGVGMVEAYHLQ
jgi:hypothetical protein